VAMAEGRKTPDRIGGLMKEKSWWVRCKKVNVAWHVRPSGLDKKKPGGLMATSLDSAREENSARVSGGHRSRKRETFIQKKKTRLPELQKTFRGRNFLEITRETGAHCGHNRMKRKKGLTL